MNDASSGKPIVDQSTRDAFVKELSGSAPVTPGTGQVEPVQKPAAAPVAPAAPLAPATSRTVEDVTKDFDGYKAKEKERLEEERQKFAQAFALQSPLHWKAVYGDEPPPPGYFEEKEPVKPKEGEEPEADDPTAKLAKEVADIKAKDAQRDRSEKLQVLSDRIEDEMGRYDDVFSSEKNPMAPELVTAVIAKVRSNPKLDIKAVVDEVAKRYKAYEDQITKRYTGGKANVAESVPAGAGTGRTPTPGTAPEGDLRWNSHGPGSLRRGLQDALSGR